MEVHVPSASFTWALNGAVIVSLYIESPKNAPAPSAGAVTPVAANSTTYMPLAPWTSIGWSSVTEKLPEPEANAVASPFLASDNGAEPPSAVTAASVTALGAASPSNPS